MFQALVTVFFILLLVYLICGVVFTFFFLARGLQKVDEDVPGSSWGFRIIIIPGCIVLWPVLMRKWIHAVKMK